MRVGTRGISRSARLKSTPDSTASRINADPPALRSAAHRAPRSSRPCSAGRRRRVSGRATVIVAGTMPAPRSQLDDARATAEAPSVSSSATLRPPPAIRTTPERQPARPRRRPPPRARPTPTVTTSAPTSALSSSGRAADDDHAAVDDREPVAQAIGLLEVVRRQEQRHALALQPPELVPERRARGRIDPGRRLVEEQQARAVHEPAGQVDPPAACRPNTSAPAGRRPPRGRTGSSSSSARERVCARERPYRRPIMCRCSRPVA